jgi:tRNA uridine 5-carboxymethylaminomethyl modification enzyme
MFTSRAEFRLTLRADNADQRLTPKGIEAGLVSRDREKVFETKQQGLQAVRSRLEGQVLGSAALRSVGLTVGDDGSRRSAFDVLAFPGVTIELLLPLVPGLENVEPRLCAQIAIEALYAPYLDRQASEIALLRRGDETAIHSSFDYDTIAGLSNELRTKLQKMRPETLERAGRIEGMTPAALMLVLAHVRKAQKWRAVS